MTGQIWTVPAAVERVVDGDSFRCTLDLGWGLKKHNNMVRLAFIDCPELSTPEGIAAKSFVEAMMPAGTPIVLKSHSLDKYGRSLASVMLPDGTDLATLLKAQGFVKVPPQVLGDTIN